MKIPQVMLAICLYPILASGQMPEQGSLRVQITPKETKVGGSVWFEAGKFSANICSYNSSYSIQKSSAGPPDTFTVIVVSQFYEGGGCGLAYGYSGPRLSIAAEKPGYYKIQFDSLSQFRVDMGDSATFSAIPVSSVRAPGKIGLSKSASEAYQANGKKIRNGSRPESIRMEFEVR